MNVSLLRVLAFGFWLSQLVAASADVNLHKFSKRARLRFQNYPTFQISDGTAGNCDAKAADVFLKPYRVKLASFGVGGKINGATVAIPVNIDQTDLNVCKAMTRAAVDAEQAFNQAINAFANNPALQQQLQNGKICNKVLKLPGEVLCLQMESKLGKLTPDRFAKLIKETQTLKKNIEIDKGIAGQPQRSFFTV